MKLVLYDTLRREKAPLEPRDEGRVSIYLCGPTVQAEPHVGHGRSAVVFDVLRRWIRHEGHEVTFVANVTDIDDKIILRARREGASWALVADRYTRIWNRAMDALDVEPPDIQPRATGHILDMQDVISGLIDAGAAYAADGSVFFRVSAFADYGKLSNRRTENMQQGEGTVGVESKEDPHDFALWKAAKPDEPSWASPWGRGRPGWHIECSAMAATHLGPGFDIHGGGLDLVFPHHENEIAQHEALHGEVFARTWVHHGMVNMGEDKMSKSIGNIVGLEDATARWGAGPLRLWYLSAHHRSPLTYQEDRLADAAAGHDRMTTFLRTVRLVADGAQPDDDSAGPFLGAFAAAMNDDLNVAQAVAALHDLVSEGNELVKAADAGDDAARAALAALGAALVDLGDGVLGLGLLRVVEESEELGRRVEPLVEHLLDERAQAREDRDFETADAIRARLAEAGVVVEDRPGTSRWYVDPGSGRAGS